MEAADYPGGPVGVKRSATAWQFFPNGRFFYDAVNYTRGTSNPTKLQAWGRYTIGPNESYGRRNLVWNETTDGEVNWENEALRRYQQNQ